MLELERHAEQMDFPPLRSLIQYRHIDLRDLTHEERTMVLLRQTREIFNSDANDDYTPIGNGVASKHGGVPVTVILRRSA